MRSSPILRKIFLWVIGAHLVILFSVFLSSDLPSPKKKQPLIVRTFQQPSPKKTSASKPKTLPTNSLAKSPTKSPTPIKKIDTPAKPKEKTTKEKPKEKTIEKVEKKKSPKKTPPQPSIQKSLREIQESIAKIEAEHDRIHNKEQQKVPAIEEEHDYATLLIDYLQSHLQLPDFGEVKIRLTLRADGSVEDIVVLSAESEKNKKKLEAQLPQLRFPPLVDKGATTQTLVLTFCNEL